MSQEWYEYYAGTIDAQTQAEIQGRAEERLQMNFDPETAYADQLEVWVEECVGYGDTVSQALRSGFDDLGNDLEWWRNEADQWQEDTNVVVRTIADVLGRADMTTHWDVFMGEQWRNLGTGYLDQWDNDRTWTLADAARVFAEANEQLERISENWNEYHDNTQDGGSLGIRASQFAIKKLADRIAPGSGPFVVEFVNRMNGL